MHPCMLHRLEGLDGAGQLALQRALKIELLYEFRHAQRRILKQFEAHFCSRRQTLAGEAETDFMHLVGRHRHVASLVGQLVRNILRVQLFHHSSGILIGKIGVQQLVIRCLDPQRNGEQRADDQRRSAQSHRHIDGGEGEKTFPEILDELQ